MSTTTTDATGTAKNARPPAAVADAPQVAVADTPLRRFASDFVESPVAVFALALLSIIVLLALLAPLITPQNPYDLGRSTCLMRACRRARRAWARA